MGLGLGGLFRNSLHRAECDLRGHVIDPKAEARLFDYENEEVETECKRCGAPLVLIAQEDETYIIKEILY